jgi:hypothetical protein
MSSNEISSLYSYVVRSDSGFAPNPFGEYCTLACCKPQIRKRARVGDWIVGCGSKALWFGHRKRRPSTYLPTFICDSLCAKRMGHQAVAAGVRAFEFKRDGGISAVQ